MGHQEPIVDVAFSPGADRVLTGSLDGTARVWSSETGEPLAVLSLAQPERERIWAVAWKGESPLAVTQTGDLFVHVRSPSGVEKIPPDRRGVHADTSEGLTEPLLEALGSGDVVMIKGSLGSRMGPVVEAVRARFQPADKES